MPKEVVGRSRKVLAGRKYENSEWEVSLNWERNGGASINVFRQDGETAGVEGVPLSVKDLDSLIKVAMKARIQAYAA